MKFSEIKNEDYNKYSIKIYVQSEYNDKDELKNLKAWYDKNFKQWYFKYNLKTFLNDDSIGTYCYSPYFCQIVQFSPQLSEDIEISTTCQEKGIFLKDLMKRYIGYLKSSVKKYKN